MPRGIGITLRYHFFPLILTQRGRPPQRYFFFVDRIGDTFRWKGENVATTEVERAIGAVKGVAQASVYGVAVAHADGRAGMAALVLQPGSVFDGRAMAQQLGRALPIYAVPLFVRIIKAQETTGTFKHKKAPLKDQGFDPTRCADPLYAWLPGEERYVPVDAELHAAIQGGEYRY